MGVVRQKFRESLGFPRKTKESSRRGRRIQGMSRREYLIDGYNLLHTAGFSRVTFGPGDLHRARTRLLWLLAEHLDEDSRRQIIVVFDARDPPPDLSSEMCAHRMRVRFSVETGEADALIEELIARHSSPQQLWVISSDHRIIAAAKRRKARSLTSDTFLDRLFAGRIGQSQRPSDSAEEAVPEEWGSTQEWLAFFGLDGGETVQAAASPLRPLPIPSVPPPVKTDSSTAAPPPSNAQEDCAKPKAARTNKVDRTGTANGASSSVEHPKRQAEEYEEDSWTGEISFWQQRIDELFMEAAEPEDGHSSERKPEKH